MARTAKAAPTIVDIANKLGVSAMTVSRALNGKSDVSDEMRKRVRDCAVAIGYHPNRWARSLVTQRSQMVGVVIPEISHSFFAEVIGGLEEVLEKAGFDIMLCHSRSDPEREQAEIRALIANQIDGLVVAPVQPERSPAPFLELRKRGVPFVLIDRFFPAFKCSSVRLDDLDAGFMATEHLIQLGHRKIGHIAGPPLSTATLRRRGYQKAMRTHELRPEPEWTPRAISFELEEGRRAMQKILAAGERPTAIFAANDTLAIGAIYACREANLRVPEDISVVGAGNIEGVYHPSPYLTTIDWPRRELGSMAAGFLLHAIEAGGEATVEVHEYKPELLIRHSSGPPPA